MSPTLDWAVWPRWERGTEGGVEKMGQTVTKNLKPMPTEMTNWGMLWLASKEQVSYTQTCKRTKVRPWANFDSNWVKSEEKMSYCVARANKLMNYSDCVKYTFLAFPSSFSLWTRVFWMNQSGETNLRNFLAIARALGSIHQGRPICMLKLRLHKFQKRPETAKYMCGRRFGVCM